MSERVLVVEDDATLAEALAYALNAAGYDCTVTPSAIEALAKVDAEVPDLVILDIILPEMSGLEVCRRLRDKERTTKVPIIMLTVMAQSDDKTLGLAVGADDYVTKPFHLDDLLARVGQLLERAGRLRDAAQRDRARVSVS
jgi:two-component system phosphate regulon response regulator PhoB